MRCIKLALLKFLWVFFIHPPLRWEPGVSHVLLSLFPKKPLYFLLIEHGERWGLAVEQEWVSGPWKRWQGWVQLQPMFEAPPTAQGF